jgi:hypothetical protein
MKTNTKTQRQPIFTAEGAKAQHITHELELRRSVLSNLLWEKTFYEDGIDIAERIAKTIPLVAPDKVANIAIEAREKMKLRHVPLLIVREMARQPKHKAFVSTTLARVIQRADELSEFVSLYWKDGKQPLSNQVKVGLASAFTKFNGYNLAKYNRDLDIKLRDVLFLCHAKPKDKEQDELWKQLISDKLEVTDTWETNLSAGKDKKETFTRLIAEGKLHSLALLRNLRNCYESGVDEAIIFKALTEMRTDRVLPFRFISAARAVPQWEDKIEPVMMKCLLNHEKLSGKTKLLIDVSGSMDGKLSEKSEVSRMDTASALAILLREISDCDVYTFSNKLVQIPARHGFALRDAITHSQDHSGTYLGDAVTKLNTTDYDRLIVITDEQSHDTVGKPKNKGYMINVASEQNGVGYGAWTHIDGFSEAIIDYILEYEKLAMV